MDTVTVSLLPTDADALRIQAAHAHISAEHLAAKILHEFLSPQNSSNSPTNGTAHHTNGSASLATANPSLAHGDLEEEEAWLEASHLRANREIMEMLNKEEGGNSWR